MAVHEVKPFMPQASLPDRLTAYMGLRTPKASMLLAITRVHADFSDAPTMATQRG